MGIRTLAALLTFACAVGASRSRPIRIACAGDSITAGVHASNVNFSYPAVMGKLLDAKYGEGTYEVYNYGVPGATVRRTTNFPYDKRPPYKAMMADGNWDIVVIMLATNDAREAALGGPDNWLPQCAANFTALGCEIVRDYQGLIGAIRYLPSSPDVYVMIPPPLMENAAYGMNQTVINWVYPQLIPTMARNAGVPADHVIDIYTALGGVPNFHTGDYPIGGCTVNDTKVADCPLYCDHQSCDQCHPNNNGYNVMAHAVMAGLKL